jgi:hypothetical protein
LIAEAESHAKKSDPCYEFGFFRQRVRGRFHAKFPLRFLCNQRTIFHIAVLEGIDQLIETMDKIDLFAIYPFSQIFDARFANSFATYLPRARSMLRPIMMRDRMETSVC